MVDPIAYKKIADKVILILLVAAIMALAGFASEGSYSSKVTTQLPSSIQLMIYSPGTLPFTCVYNGSTLSGPMTVSYVPGTALTQCSTCDLIVALAPQSLPLDDDDNDGFSVQPVTTSTGVNLVQINANYQQDDDDATSAELQALELVNTGLTVTEQCTIKFAYPVVNINVWDITSGGVAACVIAFLATGVVLLMAFFQWYLDSQNTNYQSV